VAEILSHGAHITVLSPPELKTMLITDLQAALANYLP
jgi:predicted DNA-binding transcriptional regulator YafY